MTSSPLDEDLTSALFAAKYMPNYDVTSTDRSPLLSLPQSGSKRKSSLRQRKRDKRSSAASPVTSASIDVKAWMKQTFPLTYNRDQVDVSLEDLMNCKCAVEMGVDVRVEARLALVSKAD